MMYGSWDMKCSRQNFFCHKCTKNPYHRLYCSWDMARGRCNFFSFWASFCPFTPRTVQKIKILIKRTKHLEISFYISVPKIMIICFTVLRYGAWQMPLIFFILCYFLPFYLPNSLKNEIFKKMRNAPGDIIILNNCTKNHDHMLYCSWDKARDGCNCYFSFWAIVGPFTPLIARTMKIYKKWKKRLKISPFYTSVSNVIICCTVPEVWRVTDVIDIFHFWQFLPF